MKLVDAGQAVIENGVQGGAEDEGQGEKAKNGKETDVNPAFCLEFPGGVNAQKGQEQGQNAKIDAAFDVVFNAPVAGVGPMGVGFAVIIGGKGDAAPGEGIDIAVIGRVAEKVGQDEGQDATVGEGPTADLGQCG